MIKVATCLFLAVSAYCGAAQTGNPSCSTMTLGTNGALNGFVPSPADAWHQDITNAPVDPLSNQITLTDGNGMTGNHLHPDFGSNFGIPYAVVDTSTTPSVPVSMLVYPGDSDLTVYPFTANQPVEDAPGECATDENDRHAIALDRNTCVAYEVWQASKCKGAWTASNGAIWDMTKTQQRPYGLTSVDAAGLSVFSGLIRYDEIVAGQINHAIRFTMKYTKNNANNGYFTAPATHASGTNWGNNNVIGMRVRLKANFDISGYSQTNQIILKAMKQYGMILADNGSTMFFQGTADSRWNDNDLNNLKAVPAAAFEVLKIGSVYDANSAPTGKAPVINSFTASSTQIAVGDSVTLTPSVTNGSYSYIDVAGFVRGPITVTPTATTTYTLTSRNAFGTSTASVTVKVNTAPPPPTITSVTIADTYSLSNLYLFTAKAQLSNNTSQDVTRSVVWTSSNPAVATISNGSLLFSRPGTTTVTAKNGAITSQPITIRAVIPMRIPSVAQASN